MCSGRYESLAGLTAGPRGSQELLGRRFDHESHHKDCNCNGSTEVSNVGVKSFHEASVSHLSLLFFLSLMAKA